MKNREREVDREREPGSTRKKRGEGGEEGHSPAGLVLPITVGDGWLDPLGVEVSSSARGGRSGGGRCWFRAGGFGSRLSIGDWFGAETKGESGGGGHGVDGTDLYFLGFHLCINSRWVKLGTIRSLRS